MNLVPSIIACKAEELYREDLSPLVRQGALSY